VVAQESEAIESHAGFHCWGSGIASGLCRAVGTNEKKGGEGFTEGKGIGNRKQDYFNCSISV
jgi:hypothetical protein